MEQVVPGSIVYSDLKPEAILNDVRLVKYYPTSNVNGQLPQDMIRFELRGNGFFDPYSAYLYVELDLSNNTDPSDPTGAGVNGIFLDDSAHSLIQRIIIRSEGTEIERIENYDVLSKMLNDVYVTDEVRKNNRQCGFAQPITWPSHVNTTKSISQPFIGGSVEGRYDIGWGKEYIADTSQTNQLGTSPQWAPSINTFNGGNPIRENLSGTSVIKQSTSTAFQPKFAIPLYSSILGVLMPEKKMLPLSYMPLEVEITLNQYAFYCKGAYTTRTYKISKMELHSHVISFEHEVAMQMDEVVARQGLYIPMETFHQAATSVQSEGATSVSTTIPVNAHFKSITSVHMVIIPAGYETNTHQKKLQFVSGNLQSLQIRNGINYMPSQPITGDSGNAEIGHHVLFYTEMQKSWNKFHDMATPLPIQPKNYCINAYDQGTNTTTTASTRIKHINSGIFAPCCQYGISFQGEELGKENMTITGKRGLTPFNIECQFQQPIQKASLAGGLAADDTTSITRSTQLYFIPYVRVDLVLYIRPDLVINILGK